MSSVVKHPLRVLVVQLEEEAVGEDYVALD